MPTAVIKAYQGKLAGFEQWYKSPLFPQIFIIYFFFRSPSLFLPSILPWHHLWYEICMSIFNDDSKGKSPFQHPAHLSLHCAFYINAPLFLRWSRGMTTDIGSLASGLDGHVVRLGFGRKGLPSQLFLKCTHFSIVESLAIALLNITIRLLIPFCPLPQIF
jgi:hypothetical protein